MDDVTGGLLRKLTKARSVLLIPRIPAGGALYVAFSAYATGGKLAISTAHDEAYEGTWDHVADVEYYEANRTHCVSLAGRVGALKVEVIEAVKDGTADIFMVAP